MSKKVIKKNKKNFCTGCGTEAGLLLVSLPSDRFLRPRTEKEAEWFNEKADAKAVTEDVLFTDVQRRKQRLCPQCIKPLQKLFHKNTDGKIVPVNMWGKGKQSKLFAKLRNAVSKKC